MGLTKHFYIGGHTSSIKESTVSGESAHVSSHIVYTYSRCRQIFTCPHKYVFDTPDYWDHLNAIENAVFTLVTVADRAVLLLQFIPSPSCPLHSSSSHILHCVSPFLLFFSLFFFSSSSCLFVFRPQRPCYFLCVSQEPWNSLQECESSKGAERQSWANHPSLPWTGAQTRGKEGECLFLLVGVCVHVVLNILSLRWIRHIRDKSLSRMGSTNLPCGGHSPLT